MLSYHQCIELILLIGPSGHCGRLCHVQPFDHGFRSIHCQTRGRREWPITMDAKTYPSTRRSRRRMGRLLHHTLRICQFIEANQASQAGQRRHGAVQPSCQRLSTNFPPLSSSNDCYHHQLVRLPIWSVRNSKTIRRILAVHHKSQSELFMGNRNRRLDKSYKEYMAFQPR